MSPAESGCKQPRKKCTVQSMGRRQRKRERRQRKNNSEIEIERVKDRQTAGIDERNKIKTTKENEQRRRRQEYKQRL